LSTPFQNRLVGTIIVAAAIIIFLPDLLDGKKKSNQTDFEAIPQAPAFTGKMTKQPFPEDKLVRKEAEIILNEEALDTLLVNADDEHQSLENRNQIAAQSKVTPASRAKVIKEASTAKESSVIPRETSPQKRPSAITKPNLGEQPHKAVNKEAWVIQLGSFKHKKNVEELLIKLKQNGYPAFTKPIKTKQGSLSKVFVGPDLLKSSLIKKIPALQKLTNVKGKIARFYPTK